MRPRIKPKPRYQPGDKIGGRYLVHQALMGSMGEVYLSLDLERNYPFALKTFQSRFLKKRKIQDAFYTEVATWVALEKHPNVVRCFYMDNIDARPFMFLEWIASDETRGTDLRSWLKKGSLSLKLALTFAIDICQGLIHAAEKQPGIVHRDLKPENILVAQGMVAKITDFGLASIVKDTNLTIPETEDQTTGRQSIVGSRGVVGTPAYMAPEQWRSEEPDVRTDIYALGCMTYEMLTGRLPYIAKNLEGFLTAHLTGKIPTLPGNGKYPPALNKLIPMCMAKDRTDRFDNVQDLLDALTWVYKDHFKELPRVLEVSEGFSAVDYNYRGVTYDKLDRYEEAVADYSRAIEIDPSFVLAYNNRGATFERMRRYEDSLDDYTSAIQIAPTLAAAYYNRGNVYSKRKRPVDAVNDYTRAIQLDPELMRAYINRGSEYYALNRFDEALSDFTEAIRLVPSYAKAHINRGVIYDSLGEYPKAVEDYTHALRLSPRDPAIYYNRGLTYINMSQYDRAILDFTQVIEMVPDDVDAYYYRGLCHAEMGQPSEALADHNEGVRLDQSPALTQLNQGMAYYLGRDFNEALNCFAEAARLGDRRASGWISRLQDELNELGSTTSS